MPVLCFHAVVLRGTCPWSKVRVVFVPSLVLSICPTTSVPGLRSGPAGQLARFGFQELFLCLHVRDRCCEQWSGLTSHGWLSPDQVRMWFRLFRGVPEQLGVVGGLRGSFDFGCHSEFRFRLRVLCDVGGWGAGGGAITCALANVDMWIDWIPGMCSRCMSSGIRCTM